MLNDTPPEQIVQGIKLGIEKLSEDKVRWCIPLDRPAWQVSIRLINFILNGSIVAIVAYGIWKLAIHIS